MAFSNRVIQQAIKEQMRGRVPDLNRIKREQQEAERRRTLTCRWDTDKHGKVGYCVFIKDMYDREHKVYQFTGISRAMAGAVKSKVEQYSRVHKIELSTVSRNPSSFALKKIGNELDSLVNGNERG